MIDCAHRAVHRAGRPRRRAQPLHLALQEDRQGGLDAEGRFLALRRTARRSNTSNTTTPRRSTRRWRERVICDMNIFVAGATGVIGQPLLKLLRDAGHTVTGTTRSAGRLPMIEALGARARGGRCVRRRGAARARWSRRSPRS